MVEGMTFLYFGGTNSNYIVYGTLLSMRNQCRSFLFIVCAIFFLFIFVLSDQDSLHVGTNFILGFVLWVNSLLGKE